MLLPAPPHHHLRVQGHANTYTFSGLSLSKLPQKRTQQCEAGDLVAWLLHLNKFTGVLYPFVDNPMKRCTHRFIFVLYDTCLVLLAGAVLQPTMVNPSKSKGEIMNLFG